MRTRQKLTVLGACALSTGAVLAGVSVTSHAMADIPEPLKGTVTVISQTSGSDPIKCVYDDIDLPAPGSGAGTGAGVGAGAVQIVTAQGGMQSSGAQEASEGGFSTSGGSGQVDASGTDTAPAFVVSGTAEAGTPLSPPDGLVVLDSDDVTAGTPEQCAALKPTSAGLPRLPSPAP